MRFLSPRPSSTGSIAALPAPAGGRFGLFRGYSTQRNCLLLRWASGRVQDERKSSKEVSCQSPHNEERGLMEPTALSVSLPGSGDLSRGTGISSVTHCHRGQVSSWCCRAQKIQAIFYTAVRLISKSTVLNPSFCCSEMAVAPNCSVESVHCRLWRLRELGNPLL